MKLLNAVLVSGLIIGIALTAIGVWLTLEARSARFWPQTEGRVIEGIVRGSGGDYWPAVTYEYEVNRQRYTNSNLDRGQGHSVYTSRSRAAHALGDYPVGRIVDVHYDPDDPAHSYLHARYSWSSIVLLAMGVGLTGLALAFLVEFNRAAKRRQTVSRRSRD